MSDSLFSVRSLCFCYNDKVVFKGIDLEIPRGKVTALIGPSGCGKSSFLSCLNRIYELEKGAHTCGEIIFEGQNILSPDMDLQYLRDQISMVFQRPTCFPLSVYENLAVIVRQKEGLYGQNLDRRIIELLEMVGLYEDLKDRLHLSALNLSGGQQQRLCIARALVGDPKVILFDEPCSALDPLSTRGIEQLILDLSKVKSILVVTHNMAQAKRIASYGVVFWANEICAYPLEVGTIEDIFERPEKELTRQYVAGEWG